MTENKRQNRVWFVVVLLVIAALAEGVVLMKLVREQKHPVRHEKVLNHNLGGDFFDVLHPDAIAGHEPFAELNRIREHMNQVFGESMNRLRDGSGSKPDLFFSPRLDLKNSAKKYTVTADLPGVDKAAIDVSIHGQVLTISGTREEESSQTDDQGQLLRMERGSGRFQRTLAFPEPVDASRMEAVYKKGVLKITVPKLDSEGVGRTVPVQ